MEQAKGQTGIGFIHQEKQGIARMAGKNKAVERLGIAAGLALQRCCNALKLEDKISVIEPTTVDPALFTVESAVSPQFFAAFHNSKADPATLLISKLI
jgi:hypothetical protein